MSAPPPAPPEPPGRTVPLWLELCWRAWSMLTWPATARQLRRAGFRRAGWMTWESGPARTGGEREGE